MNRRGIVRRGLWFPAELYLQPERFKRDVDSLAAEGHQLTLRRAARLARTDRSARSALTDLATRAAVALSWPALITAALAAAGVPVNWTHVGLGVAVGVASGVSTGFGGVAARVAAGVAAGVAVGVAAGVAGGVAVVMAVFVALAVAEAVADGVSDGVGLVGLGYPDGVGCGIACGVVCGFGFGFGFGLGFGVAAGVAVGIAVLVVARRVLLAPADLVMARMLRARLSSGMPASRVWHLHPARWDPHGRFPLPGLAAILADLHLADPLEGFEAARVVAANPTRRRVLGSVAELVADRLVARVSSVPTMASLATDLHNSVDETLLPAGERAELRVLMKASNEVAASMTPDSVDNRLARLRAAETALGLPDLGSALLARHRQKLAALVAEALVAVEGAQRQR